MSAGREAYTFYCGDRFDRVVVLKKNRDFVIDFFYVHIGSLFLEERPWKHVEE